MKPAVLVTGATGAIGPALVCRLLDQGYQVRVLARHPPSQGTLPVSVQVFQGDITAPHVLQAAVSGVDVIFHLAAKLHNNNPTPALYAEYQQVNVEGTRLLVKAAQAARVRRLVFFSTITVYGPSQTGAILDENSPLHPQSIYAQSKCQAETVVLDAKQEETNEPLAVVLRLAAVYGPRVKGNYARLVTALRKGWFVPIGLGHNRRTLVYDRDVANAALLAAEQPQAAGQVYNVTDGHIYTFNEILTTICQALHRPPPRYHLPVAPVQKLASVIEASFRLTRRDSPIGRDTVEKVLEDVAVNGEKIQRELRFRPQFDLATGWQESIRQIEGS